MIMENGRLRHVRKCTNAYLVSPHFVPPSPFFLWPTTPLSLFTDTLRIIVPVPSSLLVLLSNFQSTESLFPPLYFFKKVVYVCV